MTPNEQIKATKQLTLTDKTRKMRPPLGVIRVQRSKIDSSYILSACSENVGYIANAWLTI